ncbi:MAG: hypothetical protein LBM27_03095 [Lactobacillaceae bacterium]|jgi:hypothetical protein|nr:hypothetical protein [Lactobacillaceae bacterium]
MKNNSTALINRFQNGVTADFLIIAAQKIIIYQQIFNYQELPFTSFFFKNSFFHNVESLKQLTRNQIRYLRSVLDYLQVESHEVEEVFSSKQANIYDGTYYDDLWLRFINHQNNDPKDQEIFLTLISQSENQRSPYSVEENLQFLILQLATFDGEFKLFAREKLGELLGILNVDNSTERLLKLLSSKHPKLHYTRTSNFDELLVKSILENKNDKD